MARGPMSRFIHPLRHHVVLASDATFDWLRRYGLRRPVAIAIHVAVIATAYSVAFALRFDFLLPAAAARTLWSTLPYLLGIRLLVLGACGVYRGSWRHVGLSDLATLGVATTASTLVFIAVLAGASWLQPVPRSVLVLDWMLFIFMAGGVRFLTRYLRERRFSRRRSRGRRTVLIGAGNAAEQFLRQVLHGRENRLSIVGMLDDDPRTHGLLLHGVRVHGPIDRVRAVAERLRAELLVIAVPSATGEQIRRIVDLCTNTGLEFKILPSLEELLDGRAHIAQLRDVQIDDLLGREPIHLDLAPVRCSLERRTALVTGGAGSIGSELARQIAGFGPCRLVLVDQAESPLYFIHLELARSCPDVEVVPVIADVTDEARLDVIFNAYRPDFVFHAAAYKHVPMMEANVVEAVRNNVLGTWRVAEAAARHGVQTFVLISTDKAVNPSSVMGATKRLGELIVLSHSSLRSSDTDFRAVRFGNVLGSEGSVIPLFRRQLAMGGPVTVTHPEVRRYFMSIPEAVQLVLQASTLAEARGRILMLEMGAPVRIVDLAEQLIRLTGLEPYRDVQIVFTGLRPGEKMHEELTSELEASIPTEVEKVRIVETGTMDADSLGRGLTRLCNALQEGHGAWIVRELRSLVPEYAPQFVEREVALPREREMGRQPARERVGVAAAPTTFDVDLLVAADSRNADSAAVQARV